MATEFTFDYLEARGISGPEGVADALHRVLENMEPMVYDSPARGLTEQEQAILREGGLRLERTGRRDLAAEGAVRFAALVEHSLSAEQVGAQLKVTPGRVHQMLSSRDLYSFRLDARRLIPGFQIRDDKLIPNIAQVNRALPATMHPLGIFNWYHRENVDLCIDDRQEVCLTPLEWLAEGRDPAHVIFLGKHL